MGKLTLEETEKHLLEWRKTKNEESLISLVNANMQLIHYVTKKYLSSNVNYNDLLSAGKEGLIKGINKFDYKKWDISKFSAYIFSTIENQIRLELRYNNKHSQVISLDSTAYTNNDGEKLTYVETLVDNYDLEEQVVKNSVKIIIEEALNTLTPKQREVIFLRYGIYDGEFKTLGEVGEILNKSRQTISKKEQMELKHLREESIIKRLKI